MHQKASMFQADPIEEKNSDKENKKEKSAWERVELSRSPARCTAGDYIDQIFEDFTELHGDRCFGDDGAVIGGIATLSGIPVTVIGQQKGKNTRENIRCNFGMASPEGYRKALRLMKQAEKIPSSDHLFCGYAGGCLRDRSRRTRTGQSDRRKSQ